MVPSVKRSAPHVPPAAPPAGAAHRRAQPLSPAQLVPEDAIVARLAQLPALAAAVQLARRPAPDGARALSRLGASTAGPILAFLPLDQVVALLGAVPAPRLPVLLAALAPERAALARTALCSAPGSPARLLSDAFVQATPDTAVAVARERFHAVTLLAPPAQELFVVEPSGRLLGRVPWELLEAAPPHQPVGSLLRSTPQLRYACEPAAGASPAAGDEQGALPVVSEAGVLLGVVRAEALRAAAAPARPVPQQQRRHRHDIERRGEARAPARAGFPTAVHRSDRRQPPEEMMKTLKSALAGPVLYMAVVLLLAGCAAPLADKANYVAAVLSQVQRASAGISTLSGLAADPQVGDQAWRDQATAEVASLQGVIGEARALTPPEALAGPHQSYLDAITRLEQVTTTVESGVAASDPARLREAVPLLAEAQGLLTAAQGLIGN